jgi:hypothetical protein
LRGVPQELIAAGALVDREIAFEHRALRAEGLDAGLDISSPRLLQVFGRWRLGVFEKVKPIIFIPSDHTP